MLELHLILKIVELFILKLPTEFLDFNANCQWSPLNPF